MAEEVNPTEPQAPEPDLSTWYNQQEVLKILKMSKRWLNDQLLEGVLIIERRKRPRLGIPRGSRGNKFEPCYNPADVDRIAAAKVPKATVFGAVTKDSKEEYIELLLERVMEILLKRNAAVDRGPWLTIPDASRESGLRSIVIRRVVMKMMAERSPDVFRDGSVIKVRRAVLGELRAEDLEDPLDNPLPARNGVHPGLLQARVG